MKQTVSHQELKSTLDEIVSRKFPVNMLEIGHFRASTLTLYKPN